MGLHPTMSTFLFFVLAISMASCHKRPFFMDETFEQFAKTCAEEASLTEDEIKAHHRQEQPSENVMCYFKCLMEKSKLLNDDGEIDTSVANSLIESHFTEDEGKEVVSCVEGQKISECSDVVNLMKCLPKKHKQIQE